MKIPRWITISALVLFALLLGGCINIQQEYWLYEDGSAKVGMDIGMSQALISMGAASGSDTTTSPFEDLKSEFNDKNPNIKNVQVHEYSDNDLEHFAVTFEVPDFKEFLANESAQGSEFDITLTNTPDGNVLFKQLTKLDTGGDTTGMDVESMGPVFKDMYWSVTVHVPKVISTNGERLDDNTVQWKIPMADIFAGKAPGELTMVYKPKGSIGGGGLFGGSGSAGSSVAIFLIAALVILLIAGGAYYFLVYRKRPAPAMTGYGNYPPQGIPPSGGYPPASGYPSQPGGQPQWSPPQQPPAPPQWNAQPSQPPQQPVQWDAPQQPPAPPQWPVQPPQWESPLQGGSPPQAGETPQAGAPEAYPQQPPPPMPPPPAPYDQASAPPPAYPSYPQYTQPPQYPSGPAQGSDYYPTYPPQPPPVPPPAEPPADPPEQG